MSRIPLTDSRITFHFSLFPVHFLSISNQQSKINNMYTLSLTTPSTSLVLHGPEAPALVCGAARIPSAPLPAADGACRETIDLHLQGAPADIDSLISQIEALLAMAENQPSRVRLELATDASTEAWQSPVLGGTLEYLDYASASRALGAQKLRITLRRPDYWERPRQPVPLSNHNGSAVTTGLLLENHTDLAHACYADLETAELEGDLPGPARIEILNTEESGGQVEDIWLGSFVDSSTAIPEPPEAVLEGELGLSGPASSAVTDTTCSNGQFRRVSWSFSGEVTLLSWSLSSAQLAAFNGGIARPLIRFASSFSDTDLWVQLRLTVDGAEVGASGWRMLQPGLKLQDLPAVQLPPWPLPAEAAPAPLVLALKVSRLSETPCTLDVDFVHLTPTDGWRKYTPIQPLNYESALVDDFALGQFYVNDPATGALVQHSAVGRPLRVCPGRRQRFYVLHGAAACDVAYRIRLKVWYTPRRRVV